MISIVNYSLLKTLLYIVYSVHVSTPSTAHTEYQSYIQKINDFTSSMLLMPALCHSHDFCRKIVVRKMILSGRQAPGRRLHCGQSDITFYQLMSV